MSIVFVIIFGAVSGFITSKIRGSGFGLSWDVYLGVAGSTLANLIMFYLYFMNILPQRVFVGLNLYSIALDIVGAILLIYAARFYKKEHSTKQLI